MDGCVRVNEEAQGQRRRCRGRVRTDHKTAISSTRCGRCSVAVELLRAVRPGPGESFASDHVGTLPLRPSTTGRDMTRNGGGRAIAQRRVGVVGDAERPRRPSPGRRPAPVGEHGGFLPLDAAPTEVGQRVPEPISVPMRRSMTPRHESPRRATRQNRRLDSFQRAGPNLQVRCGVQRRPLGAYRPARSGPDRDDRSKTEITSESTVDSNMQKRRVHCSVSTPAIIAFLLLGPG